MRYIVLDESVPRHLGFELGAHMVRTVQAMGWAGIKNGELLKLAAEQFEVLITADQNLRYQQYTAHLPMAVIVLVAPNNRLPTLSPLVPRIMEALETIVVGQIVEISSAT